MTDEETMLGRIISDNWRSTTANPKPQIYYEDKIVSTDARNGAIRIYYLKSSPIKPHSLGYTTKEVHHYIMVDMRTGDRKRALAMRDELIRIFDLKRITPTPAYDYLTYNEGVKVNNYVNNFRWTFIVELHQLRRPVGGI
jgi:hypothetical protein